MIDKDEIRAALDSKYLTAREQAEQYPEWLRELLNENDRLEEYNMQLTEERDRTQKENERLRHAVERDYQDGKKYRHDELETRIFAANERAKQMEAERDRLREENAKMKEALGWYADLGLDEMAGGQYARIVLSQISSKEG